MPETIELKRIDKPSGNGRKQTEVIEINDFKPDDLIPDVDTLVIPDIAWRPGVFIDYRDLMAPTTEASDNYHFAGILHVLSFTLNRMVSVYHAGIKYPNIYTVLIGNTGVSRKDTANNRARYVIEKLHNIDDSENTKFGFITAVGSAEGLLEEIKGDDKVRLLIQNEFASLMSKSKQKGLTNLVPLLTELWDNHETYSPTTKSSGKVVCRRPYLSIMAGSTPEWMIEYLSESDIFGGFGNRFMYFTGSPKEPLSNPPPIEKDGLDALLKAINDIRTWAVSIPNEGRIAPNNDALLMFDCWYNENFEKNKKNIDGVIPKLLTRIQDYIWKMALLYACADKSQYILGEHMEAAIYAAQYLEQSVIHVFHNYSCSPNKQLEEKLIEAIRTSPDATGRTGRELCRKLHISAKQLTELTKPLKEIGLMDTKPARTTNGREINYYEVF